jgi:hypothetical protein
MNFWLSQCTGARRIWWLESLMKFFVCESTGMVASNKNGITSCSNATSHDSSRKEASKKFPVRRENNISGQSRLHGHVSVTYKLVTLTNTQVPGTVECPAFTESHLTSPTARMSAFTEESSSSPEDVW